MPTNCQNRAPSDAPASGVTQAPKPASPARLAAVVEAAYILEARTR